MTLIKRAIHLLEIISDPRAWGVWLAVLIFAAKEVVHVVLELKYNDIAFWTHILFIPLAITAVVLGSIVAGRDLTSQLVNNTNAPSAPFMLAKAIELRRELCIDARRGKRPDRLKRADGVIKAFIEQISTLRAVSSLRGPVTTAISGDPIKGIGGKAVWAVCGRKDDATANAIYTACIDSFNQGNHIERVFFPPDNLEDEVDIHKAIDRHLRAEMTVRAFESRDAATTTLYENHLPRGFGMTWIGTCRRLQGDDLASKEPTTIPDETASVFVHWGGLRGGGGHNGLLLQGNKDWAEHLYHLCAAIQKSAVVANADGSGKRIKMTLNDFLAKYPHYRI